MLSDCSCRKPYCQITAVSNNAIRLQLSQTMLSDHSCHKPCCQITAVMQHAIRLQLSQTMLSDCSCCKPCSQITVVTNQSVKSQLSQTMMSVFSIFKLCCQYWCRKLCCPSTAVTKFIQVTSSAKHPIRCQLQRVEIHSKNMNRLELVEYTEINREYHSDNRWWKHRQRFKWNFKKPSGLWVSRKQIYFKCFKILWFSLFNFFVVACKINYVVF